MRTEGSRERHPKKKHKSRKEGMEEGSREGRTEGRKEKNKNMMLRDSVDRQGRLHKLKMYDEPDEALLLVGVRGRNMR